VFPALSCTAASVILQLYLKNAVHICFFYMIFHSHPLLQPCSVRCSIGTFYSCSIMCHDVVGLFLSVSNGNYIQCIAVVCLTGMIGGKILKPGITRPTRLDFRTCMQNCSRIYCGASRRTSRSHCQPKSSRYYELRCQTSRKNTTSGCYC